MKFSLFEEFKTEFESIKISYPDFVKNVNNLPLKKEIPVFVYHTIDQGLFEKHLTYLKKNNYRTLSIKEFLDIIYENKTPADNSVLLTVDDARTSFWKYGYPLLKKFSFNAVLFIIPGLTVEDEKRKNLENVWKKEITSDILAGIDKEDKQICNWNEIREMYSSGLIDIESHSLFHKDVFVDRKPIGIIDNNSSFLPFDSSVAPYLKFDDIGNEIVPEKYYGLPIFKTESLMKAPEHFIISPELSNFCRKYYESNRGSNDFKFNLEELEDKLEDNLINIENPYKALVDDLVKSREIIQKKLNMEAGNNLCLPWTLGNDLTVRAAKETGFKSMFWGVLNNKRINKPGDDPYFICRIKNDFIFRLPGKGRKSILQIYFNKILRRLRKERVY